MNPRKLGPTKINDFTVVVEVTWWLTCIHHPGNTWRSGNVSCTSDWPSCKEGIWNCTWIFTTYYYVFILWGRSGLSLLKVHVHLIYKLTYLCRSGIQIILQQSLFQKSEKTMLCYYIEEIVLSMMLNQWQLKNPALTSTNVLPAKHVS